MNHRQVLMAVVAVVGVTVGLGQVANSEQSPPNGNKGVAIEPKQVIDLGPEIEGMNKRQLRMRVLTIEPGGYIGLHSHKDRPAVAYILSGADTVTAVDGDQKVLKAGDTSSANKNTSHWHQNLGTEPIVLLLVDVFHDEKQ